MNLGRLDIVPTPIGNLKDMTERALDVLKSADLILAEDTRTTGKLLHYYSIDRPLRAFHLHNEHRAVDACRTNKVRVELCIVFRCGNTCHF
jgi:16S rRNA (cytidine1402-2'-O)-methyltransferase